MPDYKIEWENTFSQSSPLDAAKEALSDIELGDTLMFTVTDLDTAIKYSVDLDYDNEEDAVIEIKN